MITATGWTFEEVGEHTLFDVMVLVRYWRAYPPAHLALDRLLRVVASAVGAKVPEPQGAFKESSNDDIRQAAAMFGGR